MLITLVYCDANSKKFKPDINAVHVRDLNFVLKSEIFVHYDSQLQASHLIFGCTLVYTSYQDLGQALIVDNPLLSYIDVRHRGFLPPGLTVGKARDLGPRLIRLGSLLLLRDGSTDSVFQDRAEHIPVEQLPEGV